MIDARNNTQGEKWVPGKVKERTEALPLDVEINYSPKIRWHQDLVISRLNEIEK